MTKSSTHLASDFIAQCRCATASETALRLRARVELGHELMLRSGAHAAKALAACPSGRVVEVYNGIVHLMKAMTLDERFYILAKCEEAMLFDATDFIQDLQREAIASALDRKRQLELQRRGLLLLAPPPAPPLPAPPAALLDERFLLEDM
jgi:hypothetical protein